MGAGRIIDMSDERKPRVIAQLRLQVNQPADHAAASSDPGALSPVQGYAAHYCDLDSRVDPKVVACSFITSGLRVFDITELTKPKEIAYFVAPTRPRAENGFMASSFAMSKPTIVPARREVWYSDGATGFYNVRVDSRVCPKSSGAGAGGRGCLAKRSPIGPRNIGRVRLGLTKKTLLRRVPAPARRDQALVALVREGRQGHGVGLVHPQGEGGAGEHHRAQPRQPRRAPRQPYEEAARLLLAPARAEQVPGAGQQAQPAPVRRAQGQGALRGRDLAQDDRPAAQPACLPALRGRDRHAKAKGKAKRKR